MKNYIYICLKKYTFVECQYSNLEIEAPGSCVYRTVLQDGLQHIMLPVLARPLVWLAAVVFSQYVSKLSNGYAMGMDRLLWVFPTSASCPECSCVVQGIIINSDCKEEETFLIAIFSTLVYFASRFSSFFSLILKSRSI